MAQSRTPYILGALAVAAVILLAALFRYDTERAGSTVYRTDRLTGTVVRCRPLTGRARLDCGDAVTADERAALRELEAIAGEAAASR